MSPKYDVMVAGHLCIDIIPRFPDTSANRLVDILRPGKLINVEEAVISTGGPVSNTGINMRTLGQRVCFCARLGNDELALLTVELLKKNGSAVGIRLVEGSSSSYTIVLALPNIDRIFLHHPGANNGFGSEDLDLDLISQCRHFHLGYPPVMQRMYNNEGSELQKVFMAAKKAGVTTSCDMALPDPDSASGKVNWRKILERILPHIDIYLPSIEETFYMLDPHAFLAMKDKHKDKELIDLLCPEDFSRIADDILAMGTKMVSLKAGHRGIYFKTASREILKELCENHSLDSENWCGRELWAPAFKVDNFGSATGSGDSCIAGLLSALLKNSTIEQALKYATCCGWQNVQVLDAVSGIHNWDETTNMIEQKLPLLDSHIDADGWQWSDKFQLWSGPNDNLSRC